MAGRLVGTVSHHYKLSVGLEADAGMKFTVSEVSVGFQQKVLGVKAFLGLVRGIVVAVELGKLVTRMLGAYAEIKRAVPRKIGIPAGVMKRLVGYELLDSRLIHDAEIVRISLMNDIFPLFHTHSFGVDKISISKSQRLNNGFFESFLPFSIIYC